MGIHNIRANVSEWLQRMRLANRVFSHNGTRNLYEVYGYTRAPQFLDFLAKYTRQDVAGRVIDAPAAAIWANPPLITSNNPAWNTAWNDLITKHALWTALERVDKLCGMGSYAVLVIGFNDGTDLSRPVREKGVRTPNILYFQAYAAASATISKVVEDQTSPDYLKPEVYNINPFTNGSRENSIPGIAVKQFLAHYTRTLHVAENTLENDVFGSGRMERVYNLLDDILKVSGGTAETYWLTANRGLHIDVDKELQLTPEDAKDLTDEVEEYANQLRRFIRTRGVKIENLGSETPDPRGVFDILISLLSGATGIPRRILTGSEAGQLASEQDRANWAERIEERRATWAEPMVLIPLIRKLTFAGVLPTEDNLQITIQWPSAFKLSPLEQAQTSAQHARSAANFAKTLSTMADIAAPQAKPMDPTKGEFIPQAAGDKAKPAGKSSNNPAEKPQAPMMVAPERSPEQALKDAQMLVTIDEARRFMTLDTPTPVIDSGNDVVSTSGQE